MEHSREDDTIPMEYLENENPFAFCKDYHRNQINMPEHKMRHVALQHIQPQRLNFRMQQSHLEQERNRLFEEAIASKRALLIKRGLAILGTEYADDPEKLFEEHLHIEEILDVALQLKKYKLFFHQRKIRYKVTTVMDKTFLENKDNRIYLKGKLELDNLKDALVYCKLEDLYGARK